MAQGSPSLAARALLALGLMIGFYVLAVAIALGLLYLPYAEVVYAHRFHFKLALFCVVGAGIILWSIIPRPDRFAAPGLLLSASSQPHLFAAIQQVASSTEQSMPEEVYLVAGLNAWVTQRGGVMGFGSRRVMGLGLPFLQVLSVTELRAVLAHEFGHYHGGDTRLGPWVYKTRAAIARTLEGLAAHSSALQRPFIWYGSVFLRVSHGVSRRQELTADALAARAVGSRPLIEGLKKIQGVAALLGSYWSTEVTPVLRAGFLPPLADGFRRFVTTPAVAAVAAQSVEQALTEPEGDPYDTHPPLKERVEAAWSLPTGPPSNDDRPAISLLVGVPQIERDLVRPWADATSTPLAAITWEDVGAKVYAPMWAATRARYDGQLVTVDIEDLAERLPFLLERLVPAALAEGQNISTEDAVKAVVWTLGATLAHALTRIGWSICANVGEPIRLDGPAGAIDPFGTVHAMASRQLAAADWRRQCADLGLAGTPLGQSRAEPDALHPAAQAGAALRPGDPVLATVQAPAPTPTGPPASVQCGRCKGSLPVPPEARGKMTKCPACGTKQRLPS